MLTINNINQECQTTVVTTLKITRKEYQNIDGDCANLLRIYWLQKRSWYVSSYF